MLQTCPRFLGFLVLLTTLATLAACGKTSSPMQAPTPTLAPDLKGGTEILLQETCDLTYRHCSSGALARIPDVVVVLKKRLRDHLGLSQPVVRQQGNDQILVDLPPQVNTQDALELLGQTDLLDFLDTGSVALAVDQPVPAGSAYPVRFYGYELDINSIQAIRDKQSGQPTIVYEFKDGFDRTDFANYTRQNIGHYLTIILDETVIDSAVIESQITGQAEIASGERTLADAQEFAAQIRCASWPIPLTLISQTPLPA